MSKGYYVYQVTLKGEVVYVGKGKGNRADHVLSGKSHNYNLNKLYFEHLLLGADLPVVEKVKYFSNEESALGFEAYMIRELLPIYIIFRVKILQSQYQRVTSKVRILLYPFLKLLKILKNIWYICIKVI